MRICVAFVFLAWCGIAAAQDDPAKCTGSDDVETVIASCTRAIASSRSTPNEAVSRFYYWRAVAWWQGKREPDHALEDLGMAIRLDPKFVDALMLRGDLEFRDRKYKEFEADYAEAVRLDPTNGALIRRAQRRLTQGNDRDLAMADLDAAVRMGGTALQRAIALKERANAFELSFKHEAALADYQAGAALHEQARIAFSPKIASLLEVRARREMAAGDFKAAAADLLESNKLAPDVHNSLLGYVAHGRAMLPPPESIVQAVKVFAGLPENQEIRPVFDVFLGTADPKALEALVEKREAAGPGPLACALRFYAAESHLLRNERAAARSHFQSIVAKCPEFAEIDTARGELSRL